MPASSSSSPPAKSLGSDILRSTGIYSLALLAPKLAGIVLLPIYTRQLAPADYAVMDLLDQACNLLAMLFGSNLSGALFFFYFQQTGEDWRRKAASTNIIGSLLAGALFAALGIAFSVPLSELVFKTPENAPYFRLMFVTMGSTFGLEATLSWLRAVDRLELYTGISLARLGASVCLTILLLVGLHWGISGVLTSNLTITLLSCLLLGAFSLSRIGRAFEWKLFAKMIKYSFPLAIGTLAIFVVNFADRFVLQRNVSMSDLGQYSVAYKIGMLLAFVHGSFHSFWNSRAYEILKRDDREQVFTRLFTYFLGLMSVTALGLVLFAKPALALLATKQYKDAGLIVPVIVLAYFVRAAGDFLRMLFYVHNKLEWDAACNWIGAVACFALYLWWIPLHGTWGAAYATLAAFTIVLMIVFFKVRTLMPFRLEAGRIVRISGFAASLGSIALLYGPETALPQVALGLALVCAYPLLLWASGFFTHAEWETGQQYLALAKQRIRRN
jgi:O-antigen/teichoic acid export membrane protein